MPAPADGQQKMLERMADFLNFCSGPCFKNNAEQPSGVLHLLFCQLKLRKRRMKGEQNFFDFRMRGQVINDLPCTVTNTLQSQVDGSQSADQKPCVHRRNIPSQVQEFSVKYLFNHYPAACYYSCHDITVSPYKLGGRLSNQINSHEERLLVQWTAVAVINHGHDAILPGQVRH